MSEYQPEPPQQDAPAAEVTVQEKAPGLEFAASVYEWMRRTQTQIEELKAQKESPELSADASALRHLNQLQGVLAQGVSDLGISLR